MLDEGRNQNEDGTATVLALEFFNFSALQLQPKERLPALKIINFNKTQDICLKTI